MTFPDRTGFNNMVRQMAYEVALDDLQKPNPNPLDIENGLDQIAKIPLEVTQVRGVLSLAGSNARLWGERVGVDFLIDRLTPHIQNFRKVAEESDKPQDKQDFYKTSAQISTGILRVDPDAKKKLEEKGYFDKDGEVLTGTLQGLLSEYKETGRLWGGDDAEHLARMLAELVDKKNPGQIAALQSVMPFRFLFFNSDLVREYPQAQQVLEEAYSVSQRKHAEIVDVYLDADSDQKRAIKEKIHKGDLGDPVEVLAASVNYLVDTKNPQDEKQSVKKDDIAQDLWNDLLDTNHRHDPRLLPVREKLISEPWYWDPESPAYTLTETLVAYEKATDETPNISSFVNRHQDSIMRALRNSEDWEDYAEGVELTKARGELEPRLAKILGVLVDVSGHDLEFVAEYRSALLLSALYTPLQK